MIVASIIAGIVPMVIYSTFLYWMDRHEREPIVLVVSVFLWGFIPAALLSLISQLLFSFPFLILDPSGAVSNVVGAVILAPITEELFKGLAVLIIFLLLEDEFDSVFDGILYGGIVGFGFAAVENILYFAAAEVDFGVLVFMRAFLFGLNHAFYTSLIGIGFGAARHASQTSVRIGAPLLGLVGAILAHMFHNGSLVIASAAAPILVFLTVIGDYIGIFGVLIVIIVGLRRERRWIADNLKEEISSTHYDVVTRPITRFIVRSKAITRGDLNGWLAIGRYFDALIDLAYKKQVYNRRGEHGISAAKIDELRQRAEAHRADVIVYLE